MVEIELVLQGSRSAGPSLVTMGMEERGAWQDPYPIKMLAGRLQDEGPADTLRHHVIYRVIRTPPEGLRGKRSCDSEPSGLGRLMRRWEPIKI